MSYDPFEVLQEKVAAPRPRREDRAPEREAPSVSLAEAAEQSGLPEAVLAAAVRKGTLPSRTIAEQGVLRPGVQLDEVEFARESLSTPGALPVEVDEAVEVDDAVEAEPAEEAPPAPEPEPEPGPEREERGETPSLEDSERAEDPGGDGAADRDPTDRDDGASTALVEVELAVQGWREAKEALEVAREEHRAELVRLERVILASEAREASTRRWGRAGAVAAGLVLLAAGVFVVRLQSGHGEAIAGERARAGLLEGQLQVTGQQLRERTGEVAAQRAAAAAAVERAEVEASRASALEARVEALEAERAAAAEAWAGALSALGWR